MGQLGPCNAPLASARLRYRGVWRLRSAIGAVATCALAAPVIAPKPDQPDLRIQTRSVASRTSRGEGSPVDSVERPQRLCGGWISGASHAGATLTPPG